VARGRGFGSHRTFGTNRRKTAWGIGPQTGVDGAPQAITTSISSLATGGAAAGQDGLTVVRIRGEFQAFLTAASANTNGYHGAFGIGTARTPAFTAGMASLPSPITDEDDELWLYHRYFSIISGSVIDNAAALAEGVVNSTCAALRFEVDSKAMRKFNLGDVLYAAVEVVELGTATMQWVFNSRVLDKLP